MTGTQDILCIFNNGSKISLSLKADDDIEYANIWIDENKDQLRLIHFGKTAYSYREGKRLPAVEIDRSQVLESV